MCDYLAINCTEEKTVEKYLSLDYEKFMLLALMIKKSIFMHALK